MQTFTIHWSHVLGDCARRYAAEGSGLFALWPSPVKCDGCFRNAGFTDFADSDEQWDAQAADLLSRLLAELSSFGPPRLVSVPAKKQWSLIDRIFRQPDPIDIREQIEAPIQWDELPDCIVAFGESGVVLRTGLGHYLFWIVLPNVESDSFEALARRVANSHPLARTELKWEHLIPNSVVPTLAQVLKLTQGVEPSWNKSLAVMAIQSRRRLKRSRSRWSVSCSPRPSARSVS